MQGADLREAQLQGVYTSGKYTFNTTKLQKSHIDGINQAVLSQQKSEKLIKLITSYTDIESEWEKERLDRTIERLKEAVGKDPIAWVKNQKDINLGILSEKEFNQIADSITEPTARGIMRLPPLKLP